MFYSMREKTIKRVQGCYKKIINLCKHVKIEKL